MNNTFSFIRFGWLMKKTFSERPVQLLGFVVISFLVSLAVYIFFKLTGDFEVAQNASFIMGLVFGGSFLASMVFNYFSTNAAGVSFLTLPASQLEKWLCGIVITGILYVGLFLLFFRLMDLSFIALYHKGLDPESPFYRQAYNAVQVYPFDGFLAPSIFMMFFNFAGAMLVGAFYFNKASFIKTALILCVICFGGFLLNILVANIFFSDVNSAFPYFFVWLTVGKETGRMEIEGSLHRVVMAIFQYVLPVILWTLAYLRLKEKQF